MDIEKKALALLNEVFSEHTKTLQSRIDRLSNPYDEALCRAIEQHEAFRREVSDAIIDCGAERHLGRFIIAKPDPLVEAVKSCGYETLDAIEPEFAADLRAALAARGLEIVKKEPSQ